MTLTASLSKVWHRVIVEEQYKDTAISWCTDMNIAFVCVPFQDDMFDDYLNTVQFIFKECSNSDLTCAENFATIYGKYKEARTYSN